MIKLSGVSKVLKQGTREIEAVKNVSLEVHKGEIFGIIGYSGAGKSTLLRCVNMLEIPTSGSVKIKDIEITNFTQKQLLEYRRNIGMVFQSFNLLNSNNIYKNIAAPLLLAKVPSDTIQKRVSELLEIVGLSGLENVYPSQLSGGQKQRVAIARALANNPEILLCDEATSALDPETTDSILELLLQINRKLNITIMFITHQINVIGKICDRVAIMDSGNILEQGRVSDLLENSQNDLTKSLFNNILDSRIPKELLNKINNGKYYGRVFRFWFIGNKGTEPILSQLSLKYNIIINILHGNITQIKDNMCGSFIVGIEGKDSDIDSAIAYIKEKNIIHAEEYTGLYNTKTIYADYI